MTPPGPPAGRVQVVRLSAHTRARWQPRVAALEGGAVYPLGADTFRLDHGPDYFAFFERLGRVEYWVALVRREVAAVGCGVLRRVPLRRGGPRVRAWYLCDLKVAPAHRGAHLPLRMLARGFPWGYLRCPRGYGVTMNPGDGAPNRVVRLVARWRWSPVRAAATLALFSLDPDAMRDAAPLVRAHRGPFGYRSLAGRKDLILGSTGARMPLLHVEWAPPEPGLLPAPRPDHVHMLCAPEGDPLARALGARGHAPSATATVVAHGLGGCDWRFIQTSEI